MVDSWQVQDGQGLHALDENQQLRLADGFGVIDPGTGDLAVTINNATLGQSDTLAVAAGDALVDGTAQSVSQQFVGIDAANANAPRRDVVYVDGTGSIAVAKGAAEAPEPSGQGLSRFEYFRPAPPDLSGTDAVVLAEVWVPASAGSVSAPDLRDRRLRALGPHSLDEDIATQTEFDAQTHPLSDIEQSGAAADQVMKWDGSAWVPADVTTATSDPGGYGQGEWTNGGWGQ